MRDSATSRSTLALTTTALAAVVAVVAISTGVPTPVRAVACDAVAADAVAAVARRVAVAMTLLASSTPSAEHQFGNGRMTGGALVQLVDAARVANGPPGCADQNAHHVEPMPDERLLDLPPPGC